MTILQTNEGNILEGKYIMRHLKITLFTLCVKSTYPEAL